MSGITPYSRSIPTTHEERMKVAWRAVVEFNKMIPALTAYAQSITRDRNIKVVAGKRTETDGKTISIAPPYKLGLEIPHTRYMCGKRDQDMQQQCPACQVREDVMFFLMHETGHVVGDSNAEPHPIIIESAFELVDEWHPPEACSHGQYIKDQMSLGPNYMTFFAPLTKFLSVLFNALEDARVDNGMFTARPGLRTLYEVGTVRSFIGASSSRSHIHGSWAEQKMNIQVMAGILLVASSIGIRDGWLSDEAMSIISDEKIIDLSRQATKISTAHQTADLTMKIFYRLNEMGWFALQKCEVHEPEPEEDEPFRSLGKEEEDSTDGKASSTDAKSTDHEEADRDAGSPVDSPDDSGDDDEPSGTDDSPGESGTDAEDVESTDGDDDFDSGDEPIHTDTGEFGSESSDSTDSKADGDESFGTEDWISDKDGESSTGRRRRDREDVDTDEGSTADDSGRDVSGEDEDTGDREDSSAGESSPGDTHGEPDEDDPSDSHDFDSSSLFEAGTEDQEEGLDIDGGGGSDRDKAPSPDGDDSTDSPTSYGGEDVWGKHYDDPGSPEELESALDRFGAHPRDDGSDFSVPTRTGGDFITGGETHGVDALRLEQLEQQQRQAVDAAVGQVFYFDSPSNGMVGVREFTYPNPFLSWPAASIKYNVEEFAPRESLMNQAVMQSRITFENNKRSGFVGDMKSGTVDSRVLGRRAPLGEERLFEKKRTPARRSYFVVIGVDCSGSTGWAQRMPRIKRAVFAQAELLSRLGIQFAIYGMTGGVERMMGSEPGKDALWMLQVKASNEAWNAATKQRLVDLNPLIGNYDGHNLEYLRKVCDRRRETSRIILYYSDGAMPAENYSEELELIGRELEVIRQRRYPMLGVGINTDAPAEYGIPTVRVDSDDDLMNVIKALRDQLTR